MFGELLLKGVFRKKYCTLIVTKDYWDPYYNKEITKKILKDFNFSNP